MFADLRARYEALEMVPLRIECHLADSVVLTFPLHLDALLAYTVLEQATQGAMLPENSEYVRVPLPLACLWESEGVPLWASTTLVPMGREVPSVRYWHRRALEPHMTRRSIRVTQGRHKELRTPAPTENAPVLVADLIGNIDEVSRLLGSITAIGKKRASAGTVLQWRIYRIMAFSLRHEQQIRRILPVGYVMEQFGPVPMDLAHVGFSPPYWHPATRRMCLLPGVHHALA